jgi:predicted nucleic acid-binding protein
MSAVVDTNMIVRYLTNDPPHQAAQAAAIIESGQPLVLPAVALPEVMYVLRSDLYQISREQIVDALIELLQKPEINVDDLDRGLVIQGLLLCRPSNRVSVPDALIWATARSRGATVIYSFDRRLPSDGVTIRATLD